MKKEIIFAAYMAAIIGVSYEELAEAQAQFVDDFNLERKEARV